MKRRLAEVRRAGRAEEVGKIVVIYPDDWPEVVRDAYDAACVSGDESRQADLIEWQTRERPVYPVPGLGPIQGRLPPVVIAVRYVDPGPR